MGGSDSSAGQALEGRTTFCTTERAHIDDTNDVAIYICMYVHNVHCHPSVSWIYAVALDTYVSSLIVHSQLLISKNFCL